MRFTIVTPSFRQLAWLKRCVRSVADQEVEWEHIIQDAGTGPELDDWVRAHSNAQLFVEADAGMYDAVNRGFARGTGEIFAYLNCDEQYLPGTLSAVQAYFEAHPEVELLAGDYLITDADGDLLSFHRATSLRRAMVATDHLYDYTCALFYRRALWERVGGFREDLRVIGDGEWVCRALAAGARTGVCQRYLAAFAVTGANLTLGAEAASERAQWSATIPGWMRVLAPLWREVRHVEKFWRGGYKSGPIEYAVFTNADAVTRTTKRCARPHSRHPFTRLEGSGC